MGVARISLLLRLTEAVRPFSASHFREPETLRLAAGATQVTVRWVACGPGRWVDQPRGPADAAVGWLAAWWGGGAVLLLPSMRLGLPDEEGNWSCSAAAFGPGHLRTSWGGGCVFALLLA
ncbi:hypothetical protein NDU88_003025 [Pleurodeles waltl]|uniref:Ig-like domain-containing protein n=1 Tax=Pleurodeles waltl TaxID=8319 RepID=A0AAV7WRV4_PLEWA|nr:hypothetical protein NDU88_003025 [Pleurodeles waltl]